MGTISGNERQGITVLINNPENVADYLKVRERWWDMRKYNRC